MRWAKSLLYAFFSPSHTHTPALITQSDSQFLASRCMAASAATAWTPCVSRALPHPGYRNGRANVPPLPLNVASSCSHARLAGKRVAGSRGFSRAHSNLVWEGGKDVVKAALDRLEKSVSAAPPHLAFFPRVVAVSGRLDDGTRQQLLWLVAAVPALAGGTACAAESAFGHQHNAAYAEVGAFLEVGVQLIYLGLLLAFLGVGTFLVIRQVLVRRELESAAKELQERVRSGEGSSEDYYELGAISLRKKLFPTANKYLEQAIKKWDGDDQDLAQVYNALGFSYYSDEDVDGAIGQYEKALKLQPGYITAWNNLGDAYEKKKDYKRALKAYEEALQFDPTNKIALARRAVVKERVDRFQGIPD